MQSKRSFNSKAQLFWIILLSGLPILLSYFFYFVYKPQGGLSYGQLLEIKSLKEMPVHTQEGKVGKLADIQEGKWLLLMIAPASCDQACQDRLFAMRQYRLGQGVESDRIKRIWVIDDQGTLNKALAKELLAEVIVGRSEKPLLDLPHLWHQSIFLIDPQGNQVMQYGVNQDHRKVMNEIGKILKNNKAMG